VLGGAGLFRSGLSVTVLLAPPGTNGAATVPERADSLARCPS
jgi:hypothetical protein